MIVKLYCYLLQEMSAGKPRADGLEDDHGEDTQGKSVKGKHNDGAADLEKVTDFVEEQEISAQDIQKVKEINNLPTIDLVKASHIEVNIAYCFCCAFATYSMGITKYEQQELDVSEWLTSTTG